MNIGVFTDTYEPQINGVVTSIQTSVEYLRSQGHVVYIFCPNVTPPLPSTNDVWRFPSFTYPFQREYRLVFPFNKRLKKIKDLNLDVIHIHTPFTMGNIGLKVARKLNIPAIHTYHTFFEKYLHYFPILPEAWVYKYAKRESERFCNLCQHIIVPTKEMKDRLSKYNINAPISILPSGIKMINITETESAEFKSKYMNANRLNCLFVGRVGLEKNIYFLINAFKLILEAFPNVHLTIIGDGPEKASVEKKVLNSGLSKNVSFTGYLQKNDVFSAYHAADLMLFPSKTETQGLTAVEAIMCGTPVIGLNEMGIKDVVENDVSGILTDEDVKLYAKATIELLKNEEKRLELSKNAKNSGAAYSFIKTGEKLQQLLLKTAN